MKLKAKGGKKKKKKKEQAYRTRVFLRPSTQLAQNLPFDFSLEASKAHYSSKYAPSLG